MDSYFIDQFPQLKKWIDGSDKDSSRVFTNLCQCFLVPSLDQSLERFSSFLDSLDTKSEDFEEIERLAASLNIDFYHICLFLAEQSILHETGDGLFQSFKSRP